MKFHVPLRLFNISEIFKLNILKWFLLLKVSVVLVFQNCNLMKWVNPIDYTDRNLKKILITL